MLYIFHLTFFLKIHRNIALNHNFNLKLFKHLSSIMCLHWWKNRNILFFFLISRKPRGSKAFWPYCKIIYFISNKNIPKIQKNREIYCFYIILFSIQMFPIWLCSLRERRGWAWRFVGKVAKALKSPELPKSPESSSLTTPYLLFRLIRNSRLVMKILLLFSIYWQNCQFFLDIWSIMAEESRSEFSG